MKIVLIGANGQLGSDLVKELRPAHDLAPLTHAQVEVTDPASLDAMMQTHRTSGSRRPLTSACFGVKVLSS